MLTVYWTVTAQYHEVKALFPVEHISPVSSLVESFGLSCRDQTLPQIQMLLSVFSSGLSIKQRVALVRLGIPWWEDSQAVGPIQVWGCVCLGTDSTWSFSSVWILKCGLFLHGVKFIVSESRNILAHYQVLDFTTFILRLLEARGLELRFEMSLDSLGPWTLTLGWLLLWVCCCWILFSVICFFLGHIVIFQLVTCATFCKCVSEIIPSGDILYIGRQQDLNSFVM